MLPAPPTLPLPLVLGWLSLLEEIDSASHAAHFFSSSLPQEFPNRPKTVARNFATFCTPRQQQRRHAPSPSLSNSFRRCLHPRKDRVNGIANGISYRIVSKGGRGEGRLGTGSSTNLIYYFEKQSISNRIVF